MFEVNDDGVVWRGDGETLDVRAWGRDSFRVRSRLMGELLDTDYALLPPEPAAVDVQADTDVAVLRNGRIEAVLRSSRGIPAVMRPPNRLGANWSSVRRRAGRCSRSSRRAGA